MPTGRWARWWAVPCRSRPRDSGSAAPRVTLSGRSRSRRRRKPTASRQAARATHSHRLQPCAPSLQLCASSLQPCAPNLQPHVSRLQPHASSRAALLLARRGGGRRRPGSRGRPRAGGLRLGAGLVRPGARQLLRAVVPPLHPVRPDLARRQPEDRGPRAPHHAPNAPAWPRQRRPPVGSRPPSRSHGHRLGSGAEQRPLGPLGPRSATLERGIAVLPRSEAPAPDSRRALDL